MWKKLSVSINKPISPGSILHFIQSIILYQCHGCWISRKLVCLLSFSDTSFTNGRVWNFLDFIQSLNLGFRTLSSYISLRQSLPLLLQMAAIHEQKLFKHHEKTNQTNSWAARARNNLQWMSGTCGPQKFVSRQHDGTTDGWVITQDMVYIWLAVN